jgi:hypothetical protein
MTTWNQVFYFIAAPRKDGTAPSLEKAAERLFLTFEAANDAIRYDYQANGFKVFVANAVIPRGVPVTEELDPEDERWQAILNNRV